MEIPPREQGGRDGVGGRVTRYGLDGPDFEPGGGNIFLTRRDRPRDPASLLYNGYQVSLPGVKRQGRGLNHPHPI
jgi:hypothetical protein